MGDEYKKVSEDSGSTKVKEEGNQQSQEKQDDPNDGQSSSNSIEELKKSVDGMQSLIGKWGQEIGEVRTLKDSLSEIQEKIGKLGSDTNNTNNSHEDENEDTIDLTAEDEAKLNSMWKEFPQEEKEKMIAEAKGNNRKDKLVNVQKELARLYVNEANPLPDELFPTKEDAYVKGKIKRASTTLESLGRKMLNIKENDNKRNVTPSSGGSSQVKSYSGNQQSKEGNKRGMTSGGLSGLINNQT